MDDPDVTSPSGGLTVDVDRWAAWEPEQAAALLAGVDAPWGIAGGWALDLYVGRRRRDHEDLEIAVPLAGFSELRDALRPNEFDVIGDGRRWPLDRPGAAEAMAQHHQTWLRDPDGAYRLDVFREPHDGDTWICRRNPSIRVPYDAVVERTEGGIPFVAPEIVLLFKAKALRDKDRSDFDEVLPELGAGRRAWLSIALEQVHPGHEWLERVRG
ncbi:nucleotidyltransferase domain-containing protein [Angustibacter luteus]|uniref:Nucleotidyltransferase domain-containing protein n=1 Tax=Angustibacter luteus TaxID=658456 RepID=A0ABW1JK15_9ACTN